LLLWEWEEIQKDARLQPIRTMHLLAHSFTEKVSDLGLVLPVIVILEF
jgi:hypothetical protein